jgi:hypothetical protein
LEKQNVGSLRYSLSNADHHLLPEASICLVKQPVSKNYFVIYAPKNQEKAAAPFI